MRMTTAIACLALAALFALPATAAETFNIDLTHSHVGFTVTHMVISEVVGNFKEFSGTIVADEANPAASSVQVAIQTASIDTDNTKRDDHLRSADFFDAGKYPEITFRSRRVEKRGDGWAAVGDLTMRGVTKEITIPFTVTPRIKDPYGNVRFGIKGGLTLNRQDYGIAWSKNLDMGGLVVSNEVQVELRIEAVKAEEPAAAGAGQGEAKK